jgi:hypothetical protein
MLVHEGNRTIYPMRDMRKDLELIYLDPIIFPIAAAEFDKKYGKASKYFYYKRKDNNTKSPHVRIMYAMELSTRRTKR